MNITPLKNDSEIKPFRKDDKLFLVKEKVLSNEIREFLESLSDEYDLSFHDQFYPTHPEDDNGAYVTIERKKSSFKFKLGNHGWSSKWSVQSIEFLTAYILINAESKRFDKKPFVLTLSKVFQAKEAVNKEKTEIKADTFLTKLSRIFSK